MITRFVSFCALLPSFKRKHKPMPCFRFPSSFAISVRVPFFTSFWRMVTDTAGIYKKIISFALEKKSPLACQLIRNKSYDPNFALSFLTPTFTVCSFYPTFSILRIKINLPAPPAPTPRSSPNHPLTVAHTGNATTSKVCTGPVSLCLSSRQSLIWAGQSFPISSLGCSYRLTQSLTTQGCNIDT